MSGRFVSVDRDTAYLLPPSVQEWLPGNHLARFVVEIVEQLDLSELTRAYRGRGLATWMMATVVAHPDLQVQRGFVLATRDAHGLYEKFGWQAAEAGRFMRITRPYRT